MKTEFIGDRPQFTLNLPGIVTLGEIGGFQTRHLALHFFAFHEKPTGMVKSGYALISTFSVSSIFSITASGLTSGLWASEGGTTCQN